LKNLTFTTAERNDRFFIIFINFTISARSLIFAVETRMLSASSKIAIIIDLFLVYRTFTGGIQKIINTQRFTTQNGRRGADVISVLQ